MTIKSRNQEIKKSNGHEFHSGSVRATQAFARKIAKDVLASSHRKHAAVIGLIGDLGAGKTTFAQAFARALGIKKRIISPTFVIFRSYKIQVLSYKFFYHVDAYRLHDAKDLATLGFKKILAHPKSIVLIEWADNVRKLLPKDVLLLRFAHGTADGERRIY